MLTFQDAFAQFNEDIRPAVIAKFGEGDIPAMREAWNDFTDGLSRERNGFNALQYHFCPAVDDDMPDDDLEFLLDAMGVTFTSERVTERNDGLMSDMPAGTKHYEVTFSRGAATFKTLYSQGPGIANSPDLLDALQSMLSDAASADESFEEWCASLGYDDDSRKALRIYEACQTIAKALGNLFTKQEIEDLNELYSDR